MCSRTSHTPTKQFVLAEKSGKGDKYAMRLFRKAANRSTFSSNDTELLEKDLLEHTPRYSLELAPTWNDQLDELRIKIEGHRIQGSQYIFTFVFSNKEIIHLIKLGVEKSASSRHEKALGMAVIAILEELLKSEESESNGENNGM